MNAMARQVRVANCFTFVRDLESARISEGIEVALTATKVGVYLVSDETQNAWTRYLGFDHLNPPQHVEGKIYRAALNRSGFLVDVASDTCLLRVIVFDRRIRKLSDGMIELLPLKGYPIRHELVWRTNPIDRGKVGVETFYEMRQGDVLLVGYPGGEEYIECRDGKVVILPLDSGIVQERAKAKADEQIVESVELARMEARRFPDKDDWTSLIRKYASRDLEVKEAFLEELFENICGHLACAQVDTEGYWQSVHMFMLHTLHEVTKHLPKERLKQARQKMREMEQRANGDLPLPIKAKFGFEQPQSSFTVLKDPVAAATASQKRKRREANLAKRAAENRARCKGGKKR